MKEALSKYQCPICKNTIQYATAMKISCIRCNQLMVEVVSGVITKETSVKETSIPSKAKTSKKK